MNYNELNPICPVCYTDVKHFPHEVCKECFDKLKKMYCDERDWQEIVGDKLTAIVVLTEILDDIEPEENPLWHKRRIYFMKEMVERLPISYFVPATKEQVTTFVQSAIDFWEGKITTREASRIYEEMKTLLNKKDVTDWDSKSFLLWMIQEEERFAWIWFQWFESIYACIPDSCNNAIWIALLHKHFTPEIQAWIENTK